MFRMVQSTNMRSTLPAETTFFGSAEAGVYPQAGDMDITFIHTSSESMGPAIVDEPSSVLKSPHQPLRELTIQSG